MKNLKNIVCPKKKYPEDYTKEAIKAIKAITDPNYKITFFGSSVFKNLIYAGDIDLFQVVNINNIVSSMQYVIKNLLKQNYIIGDIKAGINPDFSILLDYIGFIENGIIKNYKPYLIKNFALINNIDDLKNPPLNYGLNINKWLKVFTTIHKLITFRWRPEDILNGFIINNNKKYYLDDVIRENPNYSLNKIDIYFNQNNRLIELTNVFLPKNLDTSMIYDIKINLLTYLMPDKLNYLKALKRAYTISRIMPNISFINDLNKITPILISKINEINTISTDLSVVLDIIKVNETLKKTHINDIILHLKNIINKIYKNNFNFPKIIYLIEQAIKNIYNVNNFENLLNDAKQRVLNITNFLTEKYIKENNINLNNFIP